MKKMEKLGPDFWKFRIGQFISTIGDHCHQIALSWWILDVTKSPQKMSWILAIPLIVQIAMLPVMGPISDRYSKKRLLIASDLFRGIIMLSLAIMIYFKYFNLPLILSVLVLKSLGTSLFHTLSSSIIPHLVPTKQIPTAMRQGQSMIAVAGILGGVFGGVLTSFIGVGGALFIDGLSYLTAVFLSLSIKAETKVTSASASTDACHAWLKEFSQGLNVFKKIPLFISMGLMTMSLNLFLSTLTVSMPTLVKETKDLPAWFYGSLHSTLGVGSILASASLGIFSKIVLPDILTILGTLLIGISILSLSLPYSFPVGGTYLIFWAATFLIGFGVTLANILLNVQCIIATPDHYRSRVQSIFSFMGQLASPIGIAMAGRLLPVIGITKLIIFSGTAVIALGIAMLFIPNFSFFMRLPPEKASTVFSEILK